MTDLKQSINQLLDSVFALRDSALGLKLNPSGTWKEVKDQMEQMILHWIELGSVNFFNGGEEENPIPRIFSDYLVKPSLLQDRNPSDIPELLTTKLFTDSEQENQELLPVAKEMLNDSTENLVFPRMYKKRIGVDCFGENKKVEALDNKELSVFQAQERYTQIKSFFTRHNDVVNRLLKKKFGRMEKEGEEGEDYEEEEEEEDDIENEKRRKNIVEPIKKSHVLQTVIDKTASASMQKANANLLMSLWNGSGYRQSRPLQHTQASSSVSSSSASSSVSSQSSSSYSSSSSFFS